MAAIENEKGFLDLATTQGTSLFLQRISCSGKQAFLSTWGNRPNADNWNRLNNVNLVE